VHHCRPRGLRQRCRRCRHGHRHHRHRHHRDHRHRSDHHHDTVDDAWYNHDAGYDHDAWYHDAWYHDHTSDDAWDNHDAWGNYDAWDNYDAVDDAWDIGSGCWSASGSGGDRRTGDRLASAVTRADNTLGRAPHADACWCGQGGILNGGGVSQETSATTRLSRAG
jgi:hypothetical protein